MDLVSFLGLLRRRRMLVLVALQVGILTGLTVSLLTTPKFAANADMFLATPGWNGTGTAEGMEASPYRGDEFTQERARSYVNLAGGDELATRAAAAVDPTLTGAQLSDEISARVVPDTVLIEVTVKDRSATRAARLADAVANELAADIRQLETPGGSRIPTIDPVVTRRAMVPTAPSDPKMLNNLALGAVAGLLVGVTVAFVDRRPIDGPSDSVERDEPPSTAPRRRQVL
jgi:capsular polysaccharide biosynthesis protein